MPTTIVVVRRSGRRRPMRPVAAAARPQEEAVRRAADNLSDAIQRPVLALEPSGVAAGLQLAARQLFELGARCAPAPSGKAGRDPPRLEAAMTRPTPGPAGTPSATHVGAAHRQLGRAPALGQCSRARRAPGRRAVARARPVEQRAVGERLRRRADRWRPWRAASPLRGSKAASSARRRPPAGRLRRSTAAGVSRRSSRVPDASAASRSSGSGARCKRRSIATSRSTSSTSPGTPMQRLDDAGVAHQCAAPATARRGGEQQQQLGADALARQLRQPRLLRAAAASPSAVGRARRRRTGRTKRKKRRMRRKSSRMRCARVADEAHALAP